MKIAEKDLKKIAYELYKINWTTTHISVERQLAEYRLYQLTLLEDYDEDSLDWNSYIPTFDDWLFEQGYDGEIYVCFNEFLDYEYQDAEYMEFLLCHNSIFWKAYKEYQGVN